LEGRQTEHALSNAKRRLTVNDRKFRVVAILAAVDILLLFLIFHSVFEEDWDKIIEAAKSVAEIIAVAIGGGWTWYLFQLQREKEPAIGIKFEHKCVHNGGQLYLVYFDVKFSNLGKVRVQGRRARNPAYPTVKDRPDKEETLKYGCSLLLRPVPPNLPQNAILDWFNQETDGTGLKLKQLFFDTQPIEADLLYDYAIKLNGVEITDFWMEPGESYDVGACVLLPPGTYFTIVTFLGETSDDELWRRKAVIEVPSGEIGKLRKKPEESLKPLEL
jgi:hypothetical protein